MKQLKCFDSAYISCVYTNRRGIMLCSLLKVTLQRVLWCMQDDVIVMSLHCTWLV